MLKKGEGGYRRSGVENGFGGNERGGYGGQSHARRVVSINFITIQ